MKTKAMFICNECGYQTQKWMGKCPGCNNWSTLIETIVDEPKTASVKNSQKTISRAVKKINEINYDFEERSTTGIGELDRVLGGGLVKGSIVLIGGEPGIGKSTLLLQICQYLGEEHSVLYVSGEESARQIKLRAQRLAVDTESLYLLAATDAQSI